jgi:hypothetical protein
MRACRAAGRGEGGSPAAHVNERRVLDCSGEGASSPADRGRSGARRVARPGRARVVLDCASERGEAERAEEPQAGPQEERPAERDGDLLHRRAWACERQVRGGESRRLEGQIRALEPKAPRGAVEGKLVLYRSVPVELLGAAAPQVQRHVHPVGVSVDPNVPAAAERRARVQPEVVGGERARRGAERHRRDRECDRRPAHGLVLRRRRRQAAVSRAARRRARGRTPSRPLRSRS